MSAKVFFAPLKQEMNSEPFAKFNTLLSKINISNTFNKNELVAVKAHFGEFGNTAVLRPIFLHPVISELKKIQAKPYLTDTNTLYVGMRTNSIDHIHSAAYNGFNFSSLHAPVIIADGLRGENNKEVETNLPMCDKVHLAGDMVNADGMVCVSHFKSHEVVGLGGAIKNLSMGCASREGKLDMHSSTRPRVDKSKCIACGKCLDACQVEAIEINDSAYITERCVGCARCIAVCPEHAIKINWNETATNTQKKMSEYAYGINKALNFNILYINILYSITLACDCEGGNGRPVVPDIGIVASTDPVAIDRASYDLVQKAYGGDPFREFHCQIDPDIQINYAEELQIGTTDYQLVEIKDES